MVVDAVGNSFNKVHIGVPNIIDKSGRSNIAIWLNNHEKSNKVAIAVYYWDISGHKCYYTVSHLELNYTIDPGNVFRIHSQKVTTCQDNRKQNALLYWEGKRLETNDYFDEAWVGNARKFVFNYL
ncbi:MAG: hypothetical protein PHT78_08965 [Desulfitobacteriaceae bacterium]|nr:hypothetical protein [Desulfitobacteriaceae bacterium]